MNPEDQAILDELGTEAAGQVDAAPEVPPTPEDPTEPSVPFNEDELDQWAIARLAQKPELAQMAARFIPTQQPQQEQPQEPGVDPRLQGYDPEIVAFLSEQQQALKETQATAQQLKAAYEAQSRELESARAAANLVARMPELEPVMPELARQIPDIGIVIEQFPIVGEMAKAYARQKANPASVVSGQKAPNQTVDGMPQGKTRSKDEQAMLAAFKASGLMTDKDIADF